MRAIEEEAKQQGMTVELRPIIRVGVPANWGNPHYSWEGFIDPANQSAWFRSLLSAETPYLKFLRSFPGSQFVVATEPSNREFAELAVAAREGSWHAAAPRESPRRSPDSGPVCCRRRTRQEWTGTCT